MDSKHQENQPLGLSTATDAGGQAFTAISAPPSAEPDSVGDLAASRSIGSSTAKQIQCVQNIKKIITTLMILHDKRVLRSRIQGRTNISLPLLR